MPCATVVEEESEEDEGDLLIEAAAWCVIVLAVMSVYAFLRLADRSPHCRARLAGLAERDWTNPRKARRKVLRQELKDTVTYK